jgi:hypothetical protein
MKKLIILKDFEGSRRGLFEALSRHLPGETERHHEEAQSKIACLRVYGSGSQVACREPLINGLRVFEENSDYTKQNTDLHNIRKFILHENLHAFMREYLM